MSKPIGQRLGNALDNLIGVFSPKTALARKASRSALYGGYDAAIPSRKDRPFPSDGRAEFSNQVSRPILRARARDLERNSELASAILEALDRNVIGSGVNIQAKTGNKGLDERIETLWKEWNYPENCDVTGMQSLTEILSMVLRRYEVDGGVLIVYSTNLQKQIPLQLQVREVDDLNTGVFPSQSLNGTYFYDGVEMDKLGKPVAYWLTNVDPTGMEDIVPTRIPADRVTFLWKKTRPSQVREISPLAKSVVRINDLEDYNQAVAFQQKTLACTSVFVEKDANDTSPVGRVSNAGQNKRVEQISAGSVNYMNRGETVKMLVPSGQAAEFEDFMTTQMRTIAAAHGLSLEGTTRNVERVNYSSARQNLIEDSKTYNKIKTFLMVHLMRPMYKRFIDACYLAGQLDGYGFNPNDPAMYECKWLTEGVPWIDPQKEATADATALANNTTTLQEVCARSGKDWEEVLEQRKTELDLMKKLGIPTTAVQQNTKGVENNTDEKNADKGGNSSSSGSKK